MSDKSAPVLLFAYKRLGVLKETVSALQANFGLPIPSCLFFLMPRKVKRIKMK